MATFPMWQPSSYGNLPNMATFLIWQQVNQFEVDQTLMSGTLPMAMTTMTKLAHFEMWGTMLSGSLAPEIVRALAPRLENLELDRTWLSGTVPITTVVLAVVP